MSLKNKSIWAILFCFVVAGLFVGCVYGQTEIEKSNYIVERGSSVDIEVDLDYTALNSTAWDDGESFYYAGTWDEENLTLTKTGFNDDGDDVTQDFDRDTGLNLTFDGSADRPYDSIAWDYNLYYEINNIGNFDGIWMKKSTGLIINYCMISNMSDPVNNFGLCIFTDASAGFSQYGNETYKFLDNIQGGDGNIYESVSAWENVFGNWDNYTIGFTADYVKELILYETHFFNKIPRLAGYEITDSENYSIPMGVSSHNNGNGEYTLTVTVPSTTLEGNYFLWVYGEDGSYDRTIISVTVVKNDVWRWFYPITTILIGFGIIGVADFVADTVINKVTVVILAVIGVVITIIGVLMVSQLLGYTIINFGI